MQRFLRTFLILPALIIGLVVIPTVVFANRDNDQQVTLNQTISPLPTPTESGTVPPPTPTRRPPVVVYPTATPYYHYPRPTRVYPTPIVPTATPTVAAVSTPIDEAMIGNERIEKVIGDRLSSVIYAYTKSGWLYRSDDDGRVWLLVTTEPFVDDFVMNADNPDVLYSDSEVTCDESVSADEPMYRSIDGGLTWIELPDSLNKRPLLSHQGDPNSLFAADCDMLYLTVDGGLAWEEKPDTSPDALWESYHVVDMVAASLLGDTSPSEPNWNQIFAAGLNENGTGVVAFSNDLGETWVRLTPNIDPAPWGMTAINADPFVEGLVTFSEPRSVWFTENFGVNWQVTTKGLSNVLERGVTGVPFGLNDIVYHPSNELYLATARGLYHKPINASDWVKVQDTAFDLSELTGLLFTQTSPNKLWINSTDGVFVHVIE
ncbi:MAG: hypothetical protein KF832_15150 [Caldilineaceae bacterium]|nr:hypothetical protein [Caldilineaceae bacterium]